MTRISLRRTAMTTATWFRRRSAELDQPGLVKAVQLGQLAVVLWSHFRSTHASCTSYLFRSLFSQISIGGRTFVRVGFFLLWFTGCEEKAMVTKLCTMFEYWFKFERKKDLQILDSGYSFRSPSELGSVGVNHRVYSCICIREPKQKQQNHAERRWRVRGHVRPQEMVSFIPIHISANACPIVPWKIRPLLVNWC
jgi:hypothetical protein